MSVLTLSEVKENWTFTQNIGATSYWFEQTDDGTGETIGPEEVLEIGCQLEAELEERTHQYHLAHAKILSREAIIEQLSESELAKDVTKLEAVKDAAIVVIEEVSPMNSDAATALGNLRRALKEGG